MPTFPDISTRSHFRFLWVYLFYGSLGFYSVCFVSHLWLYYCCLVYRVSICSKVKLLLYTVYQINDKQFRLEVCLLYQSITGPSWSWSYGSWIYNYLCNQCLSPLTLWVRTRVRRGVLESTLCDKVCQWLAEGQRFSPGTPVSSINKTKCHDITEILLKVALNTIILTPSTIIHHSWYLVLQLIIIFAGEHFVIHCVLLCVKYPYIPYMHLL